MNKFMEFYKQVAEDPQMRERVEQLVAGLPRDSSEDEILDHLIPFAMDAGYLFEREEVKAFLDKMRDGNEMSEEELEAVAGGKVNGFCFVGGYGYENDKSTGFCVLFGGTEGKEIKGGCFIVGVFEDK